MGFFDQIRGMFGGQQQGSGTGGISDLTDIGQLRQLLSSAPPDQLKQAFSQAARQVDPAEYNQHITPGAGGTDPLGSLDRGSLSTIGGILMKYMGQSGSTSLPNLSTTDPNHMNSWDVAGLASHLRQNHPDLFGQAAAEIGQKEPSLLHRLLSHKALLIGAGILAEHYLRRR